MKIIIRKICYVFLLTILTTITFAQNKDWSKDEVQFYATVKSLFEHFEGKTYDTTQRELVFKKFIYFDNILNDTSKTRVQQRIKYFDALFYQMNHFVDSVGLKNLDAKPTHFFKDNKEFFKPYEKDGELHKLLPRTLTYFDKRRPNEPIGTLLFEPKTHKLMAWVVINQGGYYYFLTFNLV